MLRVDLMSTKISNNKVKQEVTGFFQMNENGEVSYHKLKKSDKAIAEFKKIIIKANECEWK